jgi:hypothetical protein
LILFLSISIFLAMAIGSIGLYLWLESRKELLPQRFKEVVGEEAGAPRSGLPQKRLRKSNLWRCFRGRSLPAGGSS